MSEQGKRIKYLREKLEITQEEMAAALKTTQKQVSRWETGLRPPKSDMLRRIANYLKTNSAYLNNEIDYERPLDEQATFILSYADDNPQAIAEILRNRGRQVLKKSSKVSRSNPTPE